LLGLVDQRGVGLIPYSDVFLFQIYNNQWEYTTGEKGGILTKNRKDKKTVQSNTFNPFPLYRNNRYRGSARRAKGLKQNLQEFQ